MNVTSIAYCQCQTAEWKISNFEVMACCVGVVFKDSSKTFSLINIELKSIIQCNMETITSAALQKKKINKGKLKKTIKNVLCRPDPVFWPSITDDEKQEVEAVLNKHKVDIPVYKKPLWKDLESIPKEKRPKPPKLEKVDGLIFGISECRDIIQGGRCSAVMIEAAVNPRTIIQPVLEACTNIRTPVICVENLRKITTSNFGIPTSCLGVKKDYLSDISQLVFKLGNGKLPKEQPVKDKIDVEITNVERNNTPMDTNETAEFQYLYRTNKKRRIFVPSEDGSDGIASREPKKFIGQDFIEFSDKSEKQNSKAFMTMIVKRISNNPNRVKAKS
ncbi:uncharacterized protein LOC126373612 [Pectinophora gossypiella]|uniref:uncharacterized protein LOC126373612 n=1 Tax=Pectinophora gossypiella TaxID=13191 RepID=UPI00214EAD9C|nr:uncharacterized protein LOC126373612 [Pectinophora gossypiella]